jgi:hypothetical protein
MTARGSCKPTDSATYELFSNIQRQANRFLSRANKPLLAIDGILGSKSVAAINEAMGDQYTCKTIADRGEQVLFLLRKGADALGLLMVADPDDIITKVTNPKPVIQKDGAVVYPEGGLLQAGLGGVPYWVLALVGGGAYVLWRKKAKRKK